MESIFKAIDKGDLTLVSQILDCNCDINIRDKYGRTPLIQSIIDNKVEISNILISRGADVNIQDYIGYSALHYASQNHYFECCKFLLENKAIVNIGDQYGNTPLFRATFNSKGRGEVIKLLLQYGADKDMENNYGISAFELAKTIGNYDLKQFFV